MPDVEKIPAISHTSAVRMVGSVDALLLLVMAPAIIDGRDAYLSAVAVIIYLCLTLFFPLPIGNPQPSVRYGYILRLALILVVAVDSVVLPTLGNVVERAVTTPDDDGFSPAYAELSDSAMQIELALGFLSAGENPYEVRYDETPLRFYQWVDTGPPGWEDPAIEHFVYLPANLWLAMPLYLFMENVGLVYDQRLLMILLYLLTLIVLPRLAANPALSLAALIGIGLNPLLRKSVVLGMNDISVLLPILMFVVAASKRRWTLATIFMGIACALKQYAWFFVPFYLLYLYDSRGRQKPLTKVALHAVAIGAIVALISLPLFAWNPTAFYLDTLAFPTGGAELLYPIRGFTVGRLLMGAGVISDYFAPFPFKWLQLAVGLPLLAVLLRLQRHRGLAAALLGASVFILVYGFLSRFFHENYIGFVTSIATAGFLLHSDHGQAVDPRESVAAA